MYLNQLVNFEAVTEKCTRSVALENTKRSLKSKKKRTPSKPAYANIPLSYSPDVISPELCEMMHDSWLKMMDSKAIDETLITKIELCGAKVSIKSAHEPKLVGLNGIIVRENSHSIFIHVLSEQRIQRIGKKGTIVIIPCQSSQYIIDLTKFGDAALRHKKGIRGMAKS